MSSWSNFEKYFFRYENLGLSLDFSKVGFHDDFFLKMSDKIALAYDEMEALEAGAIANVDEKRMVGHYWLRNAGLAPTKKIQTDINSSMCRVLDFAEKIHLGNITGEDGKFTNALLIGIGGSALGPQLLYSSLVKSGGMNFHFLDNTDPDGINLVLNKLASSFGKTLVVVISKSGSTPEPRNATIETSLAFQRSGYNFAKHAVAVTAEQSLLHKQATAEGWLDVFPMWDWVGGRTSVFSAVGLLALALQGGDVKNFVAGAKIMDAVTRRDCRENPAMMLALSWHFLTNGEGNRDMVIIPYKDRLGEFTKYLQQLIMESIGKEKDRDGNVVRQGLTVYGNKGSTDQHSFIQQLRDGLRNFFITIITVLESRCEHPVRVDDDSMISSDYLNGFALGTIKALAESGSSVIHITLDRLTEFEVGSLIALYERAVGFYASILNINAYHQPGVEAGKKAATKILELQRSIMKFLETNEGKTFTAFEVAELLGVTDQLDSVFKILEYLSAGEKHIFRKISQSSRAFIKPSGLRYGVI